MYYYKYNTKIGDLYLSCNDTQLLAISFTKKNSEHFIVKETKLIKKAICQINEYLDKKRETFDLPLKIVGTDFQKAVYSQLLKIEYGTTKSYKDVAIAINRDKAYRAVGMACNKNDFVIVIPCHRVIASNNNLQGYGGGLQAKIDLLKLEDLSVENNQVLSK